MKPCQGQLVMQNHKSLLKGCPHSALRCSAEEAHHEEEEEEEGHDHEEGPTEFKNDASEVGAAAIV